VMWWFLPQSSLARLSYPHVVAHYDARRDTVTTTECIVRMLEISSEKTIQHTIEYFAQHDRQLAEAFALALQNDDLHRAEAVRNNIFEIIRNTPNVSTNIIEEDATAYLSINSFWYWPNDRELTQILDFYEEIRGFDHLIVDLRRNGGGSPLYFINAVMEPNIDSHLFVDGFAFFRRGNYNREFTERIRVGTTVNRVSPNTIRDTRLHTVEEMLERFTLPELNMADMERMEYGFHVQATIRPMRLPRFNFDPAFGGKIWLLTSSTMASGTEYAARIAKNTGFATLVGERTSGHLGGERIFVALPNTGIIFQMDLLYVTDQYGRPFDAGTYPHHFNREGYDALETVLQLIAEGNY